MHELSIASDILEIVKQYLPEGPVKVNSVSVKVGKQTNILVDSLKFCFEALIAKTAMEGARLRVEEIPVKIECRNCKNREIIDGFDYRCSQCGSQNVKIISGNELQVTEIEIDD